MIGKLLYYAMCNLCTFTVSVIRASKYTDLSVFIQAQIPKNKKILYIYRSAPSKRPWCLLRVVKAWCTRILCHLTAKHANADASTEGNSEDAAL